MPINIWDFIYDTAEKFMKEEYSGESDFNNHFWNFIREENADNWMKENLFLYIEWLLVSAWKMSFKFFFK